VRFSVGVLSLLVTVGLGLEASAGTVLDRVKSDGVVRCGSVERPGLAQVSSEGKWVGLNVDICRAISAAVLGTADHVEFHEYETPTQYDAVRNGNDDVFFLTGTEISQQNLAGRLLPGPTVFIETHAVMVPDSSAERHVADLAGKTICFMIGSPVERSLSNYFDTLGKSWLRIGYSEDGEMADAYHVQHCHAVAYELTTLVALRDDPGVENLENRILPEPLAVYPVIAATSTKDADWSAIVAWTVHTLVSAERPERQWYAGGVGAMPVSAPELGLDRDWQKRVVAAVGHYGDIYERNLGAPYKLPRGVNANQIGGGLMLSPFLD
jgi:general L-amino acid transport system substrate-binding protein